MNVEKIDAVLERAILWLVVTILVAGPIYLGGATPTGFSIIMALTALGLLLWAARLWVKREFHILVPHIVWGVLLFLIYAILRYFTSPVEYVARWEVLRVLVCGAMFFLVLGNLYRRECVDTIVATIVLLGAVIGAYAGIQYLTGSEKVLWFKNEYAPRVGGTYFCPNHLAGFLELVIPFALASIFAGRQSVTMKVIFGYATLIMLAALGVTVSRGGWVACGISLLVLFCVLAWQRIYRVPAILMACVIIAVGVFFYSKNFYAQIRIERSIETFELDRDARTLVWKSGVAMWLDHPWFGVGPGHFDVRFREYRSPLIQQRPGWVHNDYLQLLVDWGVVGAGLVFCIGAMVIASVKRMWPYVLKKGDDFSRPSSSRFAFVLGSCAALLAIGIHSYVDFNMHVPANAVLVSAILGLLVSHLRFATEGFWCTLRLPWKVGVTICILVLCTAFTLQTVRGIREQIWLARGKKASPYSSEHVDALLKAYEIEPKNFETVYTLGEAYRALAMSDISDPEPVLREAMRWYQIGMRLNPFDPYNYLRYGMCLDWMDRFEEAEAWFTKAVALDPFGYYVVGHMGWHYAQAGRYAAAKPWLEQSRRLLPNKQINSVAYSYLDVVNQRMREYTLRFRSLQ